MRVATMVPIQECLPAALAQLLQRQPLSEAKVALAWRAAVGSAINRATGVALQPEGTLVVRVNDEPWRREIERSASLIQSRLDVLLGPGAVKRLVVVPRP